MHHYSFCHFFGLSPESKVPDAKTVWAYRERLKERGIVDKLFSELLIQIDAAGFSVRKGQIVDAAIVPVLKQRNTREENRQTKAGDSQVSEELLDENNSNGSVWADSACHSIKREAALPGAHYRSQIHRKLTRKRPLSEREKVRARVEHVFAQQANRLVRSIGRQCNPPEK